MLHIHNMLLFQTRKLTGANEELGAVGVRARIGHRNPTGAIVFQLKILIRKFSSIYTLSASSIASREITA